MFSWLSEMNKESELTPFVAVATALESDQWILHLGYNGETEMWSIE